jgi:hypothetical protein
MDTFSRTQGHAADRAAGGESRRAHRHSQRLSVLAVTATLLATAGTASAHAAAPAWTQADLPVPYGNVLAVAQVDSHTVWAAGFSQTIDGRLEKLTPMLLAGDGQGGAWHRIATPADTIQSRINALSVRGASDAWLVGDSLHSATPGAPILTEHWDGRSWQVVSVPTPANSQGSGLLGVASRGPDDVWAVGWADLIDSETTDPSTGITEIVSHDEGLLEHWDGTAWHRVALPADATDVVLSAITVTPAGDLWATGQTSAPDDTIADQPVAVHGDGHGWRSVPLPKTGEYGELNAVTAAGPDDVWAVGRTVLTDTDRGHPLVEHWDGHAWHAVAAPGSGQLHGATAVPGGVAVVGNDQSTGTPYGERLAGGRWTPLGLPAVGDYTQPEAVTASAGGLVVAGVYDVAGDGADMFPLVLTSGH